MHSSQHRAPAGIIESHPLGSRLQADQLIFVLTHVLQVKPQSFLRLWVSKEHSDSVSEKDRIEPILEWHLTLDPLPALLDQLKPSGVDRSPIFDEPLSKDLGNPGSLLDVAALLASVLQEPELAFDYVLILGDVGIDLSCVHYLDTSWPLVIPTLEWSQASLLSGLGVVLLQFSLSLLIGYLLLFCRTNFCY
jgi:hypothetical protein